MCQSNWAGSNLTGCCPISDRPTDAIDSRCTDRCISSKQVYVLVRVPSAALRCVVRTNVFVFHEVARSIGKQNARVAQSSGSNESFDVAFVNCRGRVNTCFAIYDISYVIKMLNNTAMTTYGRCYNETNTNSLSCLAYTTLPLLIRSCNLKCLECLYGIISWSSDTSVSQFITFSRAHFHRNTHRWRRNKINIV